jgi:type III pantothenate kinase
MKRNTFYLDIGNTRSKWLVDLSYPTANHAHGAAFHSDLDQTFANLTRLFSVIDDVVICHVSSSEMIEKWLNFFQNFYPDSKIHRFTSTTQHPVLQNLYQPAKDLGNDRWAALCGAYQTVGSANLIVINCGTATTVDYVDNNNQFLGGWIMPGLQMMFESLEKNTAQLPIVALTTEPKLSLGTFGNNTNDAMTWGVLHAQLGAIKLAIDQRPQATHIILTGGNVNILVKFVSQFIQPNQVLLIEPELILNGLRDWFEHQVDLG